MCLTYIWAIYYIIIYYINHGRVHCFDFSSPGCNHLCSHAWTARQSLSWKNSTVLSLHLCMLPVPWCSTQLCVVFDLQLCMLPVPWCSTQLCVVFDLRFSSAGAHGGHSSISKCEGDHLATLTGGQNLTEREGWQNKTFDKGTCLIRDLTRGLKGGLR